MTTMLFFRRWVYTSSIGSIDSKRRRKAIGDETSRSIFGDDASSGVFGLELVYKRQRKVIKKKEFEWRVL